MLQIFKFFFYVCGAMLIMFFLGAFNSEMAVFQRFVTIFLCAGYMMIPYALHSHESTRPFIEDTRNSFILSLGGLFFVYVLSKEAANGLFSIEFGLAFVASAAVLLMCVSIIRQGIKKQLKNGAAAEA
ncbi:MAG: hypothetical protein LAT84_05705 [Balneolia bacterium]|nr:hypothetical protein [Balneolia bacterium]